MDTYLPACLHPRRASHLSGLSGDTYVSFIAGRTHAGRAARTFDCLEEPLSASVKTLSVWNDHKRAILDLDSLCCNTTELVPEVEAGKVGQRWS